MQSIKFKDYKLFSSRPGIFENKQSVRILESKKGIKMTVTIMLSILQYLKL
jgi:hypothetical protein